MPVVPAGSLGNPLPLALKQFDHAALFGIRPFGKAALRLLGEVGCAAFQMRQEIRDIGLRRHLETFPDLIRNAVLPCLVKRRLQGSQCRLLACPAVGREHVLASFGIDPTSRDRHHLLVKARCARSVNGEPTEQHDSRDRIGSYCETGLGQIVVDQTLCGEPAEQAPSHAVFKMELHGVLAEPTGVLESDGPDRGPASPLAEALPSLPARTQRIKRRGPTGVARERMVVGWKDESARGVRFLLPIPIRLRDSGSPGKPQTHR